ncbi:MAG: S8 family peptidase, partial [Pseudomonadota bacterium]
DYLKALDPNMAMTIIWGESDSIIKKRDLETIYQRAPLQYKQFIEVKDYPNRSADHYFIQNRSAIFGGQDGVSAYHYEGAWKWLVGASWDVDAGDLKTNTYVYGDEAVTSGDPQVTHIVDRNWQTRSEYLIKVDESRVSQNFKKKLNSESRSLGFGWYKVGLSQNQARSLKKDRSILNIAKNHKLKMLALPNDYKSNQWAFKNPLGFDMNAEKAWDLVTDSKDVVIGVVDSGISHSHRDLFENIWVNEAELKGQKGVDDDGNGYVDDVRGYNFAVGSSDSSDRRGHGSLVSGLIGAIGDNGYGITGISWKTSMMSLNMFPNFWGDATLESSIKALNYAIDNGAQIINASWGQADDDLVPADGFKILEETIERAEQKGILFVAAAGNSNADNDVKGMIPATLDYPNIVSVGAMNRKGEKWAKSNYGKNNVHVMAPGAEIITTSHQGGTKMTSGTSLSAPIITGLAALMWSYNPDLTYAEVKQALIDSCTPNAALEDYSQCGGHVDAYRALDLVKSRY